MRKHKLKFVLGLLTVLSTPIAVNAVASSEAHAEKSTISTGGYVNEVYYVDGKPANWWYDDGKDWFFFQNGKKFTGNGKDNAGAHYFVNGKYANGKIGNKEYRDGKEISVENKVPIRGYVNGVYYVDAKPANWWYDDGTNWYFFQNGKKLTGYGKDNAGTHYFVNGKYANWWYNDGQDWYFYQNGKKLTGYGKDNAGTHYFVNGKYANWWYNDGQDWYFFQNGQKLTGYGKDNAGTHYFVNGEYANWWYNDGQDWYFFQNGQKLTGYGKDNDGSHYFHNGRYSVDKNTPALNMPQYYQWDSRWRNRKYGVSNLAMSGCVPTSLAMVFSGLGQEVLPTAVADTISNGGGLNYGGFGTSAKGAADAIKKYGYNYRVLKTKEQLVNALRNGESVLATVQQGYFVRSAYATHAVVLSGFDNGKVRALDPYNTNATGKWYNINEIWNQRSTADSDTMLGGSFTAIENGSLSSTGYGEK